MTEITLNTKPNQFDSKIRGNVDVEERPKTLLEKSRDIEYHGFRDIYSMIQFSIDEQRKNSSMNKSVIMFKKKKKPEAPLNNYSEKTIDPDEIPVQINNTEYELPDDGDRLWFDDI